jgi:hypothetical protein
MIWLLVELPERSIEFPTLSTLSLCTYSSSRAIKGVLGEMPRSLALATVRSEADRGGTMQPEGLGQKPFTQMYSTLKPGLFESGQHVHGAKEDGNWVYYADGSLMPNGRGEDALARRVGARLVKLAIVDQYGSGEAKRALANVSQKTHRVLDEGITRGDLKLLHQELRKTTFTEILEQFKSDLPDKGGEHLRGEDTKDVKRVYIHDSFKRNGSGPGALEARQAKYKVGAELLRRTMVNEYGEAVAEAALAEVSKAKEETRPRSLREEVLLADLEPLHQELQKQQQIKESTDKTTFTEIWGRYELGVFGTGEGDDPLMPRGRWAEVLAKRQESYKNGTEFVVGAIMNEYGPDVTKTVLAKVAEARPQGIGEKMTPNDLELLHRELQQRQTLRDAPEVVFIEFPKAFDG